MSTEAPLADRSVRAAQWNYVGSLGRTLAQFAVGVLLARLLGPEAFGLTAIAWLLIGAGRLFADLGFSAALIQRAELDAADVDLAATMQLLIGALLTLLSFSAAPVIAAFFRRPDAAPVIEAMSPLFVLHAAGQVPTALLNRDLQFRRTQTAQLLTYLLGYLGVGVPAALSGFGVWSLVAAQLVQAGTYAGTVMVMARRGLRLRLSGDRARLFSFGGKVMGANATSWAILNLDTVIIGRFQGVTDLGLYNRSMSLVQSPIGALVSSLQGVLFSACSRAQHDPVRLRAAFLAVTEFLAYSCLPIVCAVALVPDVVILGVYGPAWSGAVPLLAPLSLAIAVHALLAVVGPVLMSIDRTQAELRAQLVTVAAMVPALWLAAQHSMPAVAWTVAGVYALRWGLLLAEVCRDLQLRAVTVLAVLVRPACVALPVGLAALGAATALEGLAPPVLRLAACIAASALTLLLVLRVLGPLILSGPVGHVLSGRRLLPPGVARWLRVERAAP